MIDISTASRRLGVSERAVRRRCRAGNLPGAVKQGAAWAIPLDADVRLSGVRVVGSKIDPDALLKIPKDKKEDALRKLGTIQGFERFSGAHVRAGGLRTEAMNVFCTKEKISLPTLKRWIKVYREQGLVGLVDTRGGQVGDPICPGAWEHFKSLYLDDRQPSIKQCLRIISYLNKVERRGWLIPSYASLCRHIDKHLPRPVQVLFREGQGNFDAKCGPFVQSDFSAVDPGAWWIGDHHQLNCVIRFRNEWIRPWLTVWEDLRSRAIVGWFLCPLPNQTTILRSFKMAAEIYGPPEHVKIDNGRDYDSRMFMGATKRQRRILQKGYLDLPLVQGLYGMLGVGVSFAIPYHPQGKAVERWFDTLDQQFCKALPTYCGKDSARKPEALNEYLNSPEAADDGYTLETLEPLLTDYIAAYNHSPHSTLNGRSPAEVMAERKTKRACTPGVLSLLLQVWSGNLKVGKNGVQIKGLWYGQFNNELLMHQGKYVRCAYDPDDMSRVYVYAADDLTLVTVAEQSQLLQYGHKVNEEQLREAMRSKARAARTIKSHKSALLVKNSDLPTLAIKAKLAEARPAPKLAQSPIIRPLSTPLDDEIAAAEKMERKEAARQARRRDKLQLTWDGDPAPKQTVEPLDWDDDVDLAAWLATVDGPKKSERKKISGG